MFEEFIEVWCIVLKLSIIFLYDVIISCNNLDILEKGIRDVCK